MLSYDSSLELYQMMICELLWLCSFAIMLDFGSAIFKVVGRRDFLKNMAPKVCSQIEYLETSSKSKSIWQVCSQLDSCTSGSSGSNILSDFVWVHAQSCMYPLWWKSITPVLFLFFFPVREPGVSVLSFWVGAGFIYLAVTTPRKGETKQSLTKRSLEK